MIESIIDNKKLLLENEDELLQTINDLYLINRKYSFCYQYVDFVNVEVSSINNFVSIFNADDITTNSWISIVQRLQQKVDQENEKTSKHKLKKKQGIDFQSQNDKFKPPTPQQVNQPPPTNPSPPKNRIEELISSAHNFFQNIFS